MNVGKKTVQKIDDEFHARKKNADALQLELRSIDDRLAFVRKSFSDARNPKEYFSLEAEMKQLSEKQSSAEEQLFSVLNELEQTAHNLKLEQQKYATASHAIEQEVARAEKVVKDLESDTQRAFNAIESLKPAVQPELLEKFLLMKQRVSDPVVPVVDVACSGCSNMVLEKDLHTLARRTLVECRSCFRLLYLPSAV